MKNIPLIINTKSKFLSSMRASIPTKRNKTNYAGVAVTVGLLLTTGHALHADIIQPSGGASLSWGTSIAAVETGQSFTADSSVTSLKSIGFIYRDVNPTLPAPSMRMDLFAGVGYGGAVLDSDVVVAYTGVGDHWEDFDFSGNTLVSGQTYSFRLAAAAGPVAGGYRFTTSDPYAGGSWLDSAGNPITGDMAFRILGVPEPSTTLLLCLGLMAMATGRSNLRRYSN